MCDKICYLTAELAKFSGLKLESQRRKQRRINSYFCSICGYWHWGHTHRDKKFDEKRIKAKILRDLRVRSLQRIRREIRRNDYIEDINEHLVHQ